jgi:hypothetical protein
MKSEKKETAIRWLLNLICFVGYIALLNAIVANAFDTNLYHFLLG